MVLLVISAVLASLALGVMIAYAVCLAMFELFRVHVHGVRPATLRIEAKTAHP